MSFYVLPNILYLKNKSETVIGLIASSDRADFLLSVTHKYVISVQKVSFLF